MLEAVENQSPDVVIVDEISAAAEVEAARTVSQRGVRLVATIHGQTLGEVRGARRRRSAGTGSSANTQSPLCRWCTAPTAGASSGGSTP